MFVVRGSVAGCASSDDQLRDCDTRPDCPAGACYARCDSGRSTAATMGPVAPGPTPEQTAQTLELMRARPPEGTLRWLVDAVAPGGGVTDVAVMPGGSTAAMHRVTMRPPNGTDCTVVLRRDFHPRNLLWFPPSTHRDRRLAGHLHRTRLHRRWPLPTEHVYYDALQAERLRTAWERTSVRTYDPWADVMSIVGTHASPRTARRASRSLTDLQDTTSPAPSLTSPARTRRTQPVSWHNERLPGSTLAPRSCLIV